MADDHPLKDFALGALATSSAVCITNPLDVIKTRMQLQDSVVGSGGPLRLRNPLQALWVVGRHEGLRGLQRGLSAAVPYQVCMNGFRLGAYAKLTKRFADSDLNSQLAIAVRVAAGFATGFVGNFMASPFYLLKIRFQSYSTSPLTAIGTQHHYTGLLSGFRQIVRDSHPPSSTALSAVAAARALFHGATVGSLRVAVASAVQLTAYDSIKISLAGLPDPFAPSAAAPFFARRQPVWLHTVASLLTGVIVIGVMNPIDVVATRLYNQAESGYVGAVDVAKTLYRAEGIRAFYKGFLSGWLRVGPHTLCTFVFLEHLRVLFS